MTSTVPLFCRVIAHLGDFMAIDLSGGPEAESYPATYYQTLADVPGGPNSDLYKTNSLLMRRIPKGVFTTGSPSDELGRFSNEAQRRVTLTKDYYIGVFQVTQKQWELVMGANPSPYLGDARPVERVSYYDIRENPNNSAISPNWPQSSQVHVASFMGKLREKTGLTMLDLPTEAQWERAGRAGTGTALNSGKNLTRSYECPNMAEVGRYRINNNDGKGGYSGHTTVGSYLPNSWGLYDMHGNVFEWCLDWHETYHAPTTDPVGAASASGSGRVLRGGGWYFIARHCRSAIRSFSFPDFRYYYGGFRLARTLP